MSRKLTRAVREQIAAVEWAGGSARFTRDGHVVFHAKTGEVIGRSRATRMERAAPGVEAAVAAWRTRARVRQRPDEVVVIPEAPAPVVVVPEAATSPTPEEVPVEKVIRVCDACEADGRGVVGATDSVKIESLVTGRKARVDLCNEHLDAMFAIGAVVPIRSRRVVANSDEGRTFAADMRCPVCGEYEGPGQGMFQHARHRHPDAIWGDDFKQAAREAFQAAHSNGKARVAASA